MDKERIISNVLKLYTVKKVGKSNEGIEFFIGDKFKVLERDIDVVLIEKVGDSNNPYFVPEQLLCSISDYE